MTNLTAAQVYDSIIWSADVDDSLAVLEVVSRAPKLKTVKIDRAFIARAGDFSIIEELTDLGLQVFFDDKISEIPSKLEAVAKADCKYGPWMLNCMAGSASGGPLEADDPETVEGLKRFADACLVAGVRPCAVTVLTSKKEELVLAEFGKSSADQVLYYVELLLACGFTDVVCSPLEVPVIRSERRFDGLDLNTPGVPRAAGSCRRTSWPRPEVPDGAPRLSARLHHAPRLDRISSTRARKLFVLNTVAGYRRFHAFPAWTSQTGTSTLIILSRRIWQRPGNFLQCSE